MNDSAWRRRSHARRKHKGSRDQRGCGNGPWVQKRGAEEVER